MFNERIETMFAAIEINSEFDRLKNLQLYLLFCSKTTLIKVMACIGMERKGKKNASIFSLNVSSFISEKK